ncbi:uncharacterized protein A4U43_C07F10800 [Asparagus officinalis]|uniref:Uncharacterized protein n=1 Tax=Asparagus officinalis TaxID=4686 RepID=A0A5P1EB01_ASPOF|nr:uncharacterized protein A4U43_C07F10800 [Asparagus officinalis]
MVGRRADSGERRPTGQRWWRWWLAAGRGCQATTDRPTGGRVPTGGEWPVAVAVATAVAGRRWAATSSLLGARAKVVSGAWWKKSRSMSRQGPTESRQGRDRIRREAKF